MDKIDKMQYKNLRQCFNTVVNNILGEDYYNMGMDVRQADQICTEDIINEFKNIKHDLKLYKNIAIMAICINFMMLAAVIYIKF